MSEQQINERINIKTGNIPHTIIYLLLPVEGLGLIVFLAYAAFHFQDFIAQSTAIFSWALWFGGLSLYALLGWFAVKVLRSAIDALVALAHGAVEVRQKFIASSESKRNYQLE